MGSERGYLSLRGWQEDWTGEILAAFVAGDKAYLCRGLDCFYDCAACWDDDF